MIRLLRQHRALLLYLIFGGLTTVVNVLTYALCFSALGMGNVISTCAAWFVSVLFAFITNKLWVFDSWDLSLPTLLREGVSFFLCRLLTGFMDVGIMFLAVDVFHLSPIIWKIIANILVVIANWAVSKCIIFARRP